MPDSLPPGPYSEDGADLRSFEALADSVRLLLDAFSCAVPPPHALARLTVETDNLAASFSTWRVPDKDIIVGRLDALAGRGHPLLPPFVIDSHSPESIRGRVTLSTLYLGSPAAAHGGTVSLLFDEVLGTLVNVASPTLSRTAFIKVDFFAVTPVDAELTFEASVERVDGRKRFAVAQLRHRSETVATAKGLFVDARPPESL